MTENQLTTVSANLFDIRTLSPEERAEISYYILNAIPYVEIAIQKMFPVTETPQEKMQVFCSSYRLLESARNMVADKGAKEKLNLLLNSCKQIYEELYKLLMLTKTSLAYGQSSIHQQIINVFLNSESNQKINLLIDYFLALAEKTELMNTNTVSGIEMSTPEGKELKKFLDTDDGGIAKEPEEKIYSDDDNDNDCSNDSDESGDNGDEGVGFEEEMATTETSIDETLKTVEPKEEEEAEDGKQEDSI